MNTDRLSEITIAELKDQVARLEKRLARERKARTEAEATAERGLRDLYEINCALDERVQERLAETVALTEEANRAQKVKSAFLANVSHELRTPLLAVMGSLELLASSNPELVTNEYFSAASRGSEELQKLIESIFDIVDLETGSSRNSRTSVDLHRFVEDIAGRWRIVAAKAGLLFTSSIDPRIGAAFLDAHRLNKALDQVLTNAVTFSETGTIALTIERRDATVSFVVADEGPGMTADVVDRLTAPFEVGDQAPSRSHQGAGFGLTVTRGLVEIMGAELSIESAPGAGTKVRVTLPDAFSEPEPARK